MIHGFGDCELDRELFQLRRSGEIVPLEPKVFDVLAYLLEQRERVVTKDELLGALWPGEAVSESVLPRCIAAARRAVGDDRARQRAIQTVHGRGYRFVAPLRDVAPSRGRPAPPEPAVREPHAAAGEDALRPFVGREDAMRRLGAALDQTLGGAGRIALLVGEPGIGKTRAAEELAALGRRRGARVLLGRCYEGEGAPAFWPFVQVLRDGAAGLPAAALAADLGPGGPDLAELVPELRERLPELGLPSPLQGEQARFRLFDSVAGFLRRSAARQPLVVVLDDLHWADTASLRLFEFLAAELRDAALLLVGTFRDTDVRREHPLAGVLGALARAPHCERIALRGLALPDVERFLAGVLPALPDAGLASAVHDMTEGNPFFIHEMARLLAEPGRLPSRGASGSWTLALPQSVRDAVGRRLDTLSPACNTLLRAAAVLGREFSGAVLGELTGLDAEERLETLGEALAAHVLQEVREDVGRYGFGHALVRQTLYDELSAPERVRLHRRAGQALETAGGAALDAHLDELAHHFFQAAPGGDIERALDYGVRAARRAHQLHAYEESAHHYERALAALGLAMPPDEARRCELLIAAGEAYYVGGARELARERCGAAAAIARSLGRADLLARAAVEFRGAYEMGAPTEPETLALMTEALAAIGGDHPLWRARLLARLVGTRWAPGMDERDRLSREAHALARASGDTAALRDALGARWWATLGPDRVAERHAVADEILALAQQEGDETVALLGLECRLGAQLIEGRMREADASVRAYAELAEKVRQPAFRFLANVIQGSRALDSGRFEEAAERFGRSLEIGRGKIPFAEVMYHGQMSWLGLMRGGPLDLAEVESFLRTAPSRYEGTDNLLRAALAYVFAGAGRVEDARREFQALAREDFADLPRNEHWLLTLALLVDVVFYLDDERAAAALYERLAPYGHLFVVHDLIRATSGSVQALLGELASELGHFDAALAHYDTALERESAEGVRPTLLASQASLARCLVLRGKPGDVRRADALMKEVERGCAEMGSRALGRYQERLRAAAARRR